MSVDSDKPIVGGGLKKVLYTLATVQKIGINKSTKALLANNTCKACALGMGGQRGGMTNELGEFPAVCNKSVQAQSTDIQPAIPDEIFNHTITDLKELDEKELAHLGRLNTPLVKQAGEDKFSPISWQQGLDIAAQALGACQPERSFFYSSGRSSNEAGFILQLMARFFGTNNVNNCSYYCHQATSVALKATVGTGTATIELEDITGCDLIFLVGANPASNHPRLLHQLKALRDRGGDVVVINPAKEPGLVRFAVPKSPASLLSGGTWIASDYLQPNIGSDQFVFMGIAKALLAMDAIDHQFIEQHCLEFVSWQQQIAETNWQTIEQTTGLAQTAIETVAARYAKAKNVVFAWGMGLTHQLDGVGSIEQLVNLALLRGMIGKRFAGLLPLRGHSNVQGIGSIGVKPVLESEAIKRFEEIYGLKIPEQPGLDTMAAMQAAANGKIDTALIMGGNLFAANPNSEWAATALNKIHSKIFLTTTLNRGHLYGCEDGQIVILPVCARDEEQQATSQESMFNYVRLSDGGIKRLDNTRPESWILSELGMKVVPQYQQVFKAMQSHSSVRAAISKLIPGMEQLQDLDVAGEEFHLNNRLLHEPEFLTHSGKASFSMVPKSSHPAGADVYPFTLATVRSEGQFNSIVYEQHDSYRGTRQRWCVLMNIDDIKKLGVRPGDRVDLTSAQGTMAGVLIYAFDLPAGNCLAYYPEANVLTANKVDPRSKTPGFKSTAIKINRH